MEITKRTLTRSKVLKGECKHRVFQEVPCGLVVRIRRSHRRGRGSIPRMGVIFMFFFPATNNVAPPPIESPEQQRELQLLEDVLEKARKIRISQPMDQPQRVVRRTENAAKLAEAVYKPSKKQSVSHRLPPSRSQGSAKTTLQKRLVKNYFETLFSPQHSCNN